MKKVLITGGCGYLGARISNNLAEKGYRITVFDRFDPHEYKEWVSEIDEVIIGDIRDQKRIDDLTRRQFDAVIHLISLDHFKSEEDPNFVSSVNVMPTWNLLDGFSKNGLKTFIYFSTIHVYGKNTSETTTERAIPAPKNAYALTHLLSEGICNYYNEKTESRCINVRLSNSYGSPVFKENNCWWLVINDLCKTAFEHGKIKLLSDGSPQRDFIHSSDICNAIEMLIESPVKFEENAFHICSGTTLTILELAHIVKDVFHKKYQKDIPVFLSDGSISNSPDSLENRKRYCFDNTKIRGLGFEPTKQLTTGIEELFEYLEKGR